MIDVSLSPALHSTAVGSPSSSNPLTKPSHQRRVVAYRIFFPPPFSAASIPANIVEMRREGEEGREGRRGSELS